MKGKGKNKDRKEQGVKQAAVKVWELNDFVVFKLGFLQLICKASLIFKSHFELSLLIILKERELY